MAQQLVIKLTEAATKKYLEICSGKLTAEVSEDCLPSGASLKVDICPPFGCLVSIGSDGNFREIGEADADLVDVAEK